MNRSMPRLRPMAAVAALLAGFLAVVVTPAPAHATTAAFSKDAEWPGGYIGIITVHNDTDSTLTGWRVEFDLPPGTSIQNYWSADLTRAGSRYVFAHLPWNGSLAPGASTSFGWVARGLGVPVDCVVNGAPCDGGPPPSPGPGGRDMLPPTTPTNPRVTTLTPEMTLEWDAATDDHGVAGYEIFFNGGVIATTTGTSHSMPVPPPVAAALAVRAFDEAGNRSPYVLFDWATPPDSGPPTAPVIVNLLGPGEEGIFELSWEPATDDVIVAGYEVRVSGEVISQTTNVGGTSLEVPYEGYGTYLFRIRAFDGLGQFGPAAEVGIAIDPPAPPPSLTPPSLTPPSLTPPSLTPPTR